jgi:hypothetical protein
MMANMSYCRFRNTLEDLRDCRRALSEMGDFEKELTEEEADAAKRLFKLCRELADDYAPDDESADDMHAYAAACVAAERERFVRIVESYPVPVGNSPAGELAAQWTMDALREIRDQI